MLAVELFSGPRFAFLCVNTGPFFVSLCCFVFKNLVFLAETRDKKKRPKKTPPHPKKKQFYVLKFGPAMLRNILGPVFNLDQFLTHKTCYFLCLLFLG